MKVIGKLAITGILLLIVGCQIKEETLIKGEATLSTADVTKTKGYCALTAAPDSRHFLMLDKLFSEGIACHTNDDCYDFLLEQDDSRSLAPEFHPYLSCEAVEEPILPAKINIY